MLPYQFYFSTYLSTLFRNFNCSWNSVGFLRTVVITTKLRRLISLGPRAITRTLTLALTKFHRPLVVTRWISIGQWPAKEQIVRKFSLARGRHLRRRETNDVVQVPRNLCSVKKPPLQNFFLWPLRCENDPRRSFIPILYFLFGGNYRVSTFPRATFRFAFIIANVTAAWQETAEGIL